MMGEWRLNKQIPFSAGYTAEFRTLYVDQRDAMCDSVRPEMGIADCAKNRKVLVKDFRGIAVFSKEVSREEGNQMYLEMKPLDNHGYGKFECLAWLEKNGVDIKKLV